MKAITNMKKNAKTNRKVNMKKNVKTTIKANTKTSMKSNTKENIKADYIWTAMLFLIYPLIMTNGYRNITITKYIFCGMLIIAGLTWTLTKKYSALLSEEKNAKIIDLFSKDRQNFFLLLFVISNVIACLFSDDMGMSFVAGSDKHMGLFFAILLVYSLICNKSVKEKVWASQVMVNIITLGLVLVILFALIQFLGLDLFGLLKVGSEVEQRNFLSTLGNTAVYGKWIVFLGFIVFYAIIWKVQEMNRLELALGVAFLLLWPVGLVCSNVDTAVGGFALGMYLLLMVCIRIKREVYYFAGVGVMQVGLLIFNLIYSFDTKARNLSAFGRIMISSWAIHLAIIAFCVVYAVLYQKAKHSDNKESLIKEKSTQSIENRKIIVILMSLFLVFIVVGTLSLICYFSLINRQIEMGRLTQYLRFDNEWGTERGYVWTWCGEIFLQGNIIEKLIGYGQGMVPGLLDAHCGEFMKNELGYIFDNAHNVYLHQLLSIGVIGVLSYLLLLAESIRIKWQAVESRGVAIALIVFAVMDLISIYEPITQPVFWFMMG